jgi:hypothetical protein
VKGCNAAVCIADDDSVRQGLEWPVRSAPVSPAPGTVAMAPVAYWGFPVETAGYSSVICQKLTSRLCRGRPGLPGARLLRSNRMRSALTAG